MPRLKYEVLHNYGKMNAIDRMEALAELSLIRRQINLDDLGIYGSKLKIRKAVLALVKQRVLERNPDNSYSATEAWESFHPGKYIEFKYELWCVDRMGDKS